MGSIICHLLSNKYFASTLHNSVFPTPVGPKKIKLQIGRFGLFNPALVLRIALVSFSTASSCPTIDFFRASPIFNNLSDNTFKLSTSNFVNAQISFFSSDPRKKYYGLAKFANVGNISLGYLVNKSTYFSKHAWRLSTTLPIMKHLSVEPEFYFSPSTKQLYPGVRFKIM